MHERYQRDIQLMQEEFKQKLNREIQLYISSHSGSVETGSLQAIKVNGDKSISNKRVLETAKKMLHQPRGEAKSTEMDWDYYGVPMQPERQSGRQGSEVASKEREISERAASTQSEVERHPHDYPTLGLSAVEKMYPCEKCQRKHEPPFVWMSKLWKASFGKQMCF